ncbi:hypothetical protein SEL4614_02540 [Salmonella enterica subsp. enterica serovar 4,[5],12:i:-]|uniref:Uncharacterized protein n=1 Tax=Salmonella enterica subsp. enterica serovar 4,[5],12:i:- TaxID=440524 RepID=A0A8D5DCF2_SALET|nr:hypothetical protein SEL4578_02540 [Salmonella enterica subsp. enterica serovar 4,[5],12:i:-]BCI34649.1 hypothetical protein SEL4614_02540 [Salmonella enterica subsp. enterica serovar 4,[5],12:i:-]
MDKMKRHLVWWGAGILVAVAAIAWWMLRPAGIPEGFAASNGRIEATEVDIATKIAGRIDTILVSEGQFVRQGEVLAKMDTRVLQEQRLEAIAQIKEAESAVAAARALLEQRQSEMRAAQSVVKQREAELDSVSKRHVRSRSLSQRGAVSVQQLDDDRAPPWRPPKRRYLRQKRRLRRRVPVLSRRKRAWKRRRRPSGVLSPTSTTAN